MAYDVDEGDLVISSAKERHSIQPVLNQVYSTLSIPLNMREMFDEIERLWKQGHYIGNFRSTPVASFITDWFHAHSSSHTHYNRLARELLMLVLAEEKRKNVPSMPRL